jgi:flagellar motor switch protein FliM
MQREPRVRIEMGRAQLPTEAVAQLGVGSIVELSAGAEDDVDLSSGGCLIARGEAVEVEGELCVRVRHVASVDLKG